MIQRFWIRLTFKCGNPNPPFSGITVQLSYGVAHLRLRLRPTLLPYGQLLWAAWSRLLLVPPSKYQCLVCVLVALQFLPGVLVVLFRFFVSSGIKGSLCGVFSPSTPLWDGLVLLCSATLRYSSLMFQDPHWTSGKALEYRLWFPFSPVLCYLLAPYPPSVVWCFPVSVFCSAPAALPSLLCLSALTGFWIWLWLVAFPSDA